MHSVRSCLVLLVALGASAAAAAVPAAPEAATQQARAPAAVPPGSIRLAQGGDAPLAEAARTRGRALLAAQPDLAHAFDEKGLFEAEAGARVSRFVFSSRPGWPVWIRSEGRWRGRRGAGARKLHAEIGRHLRRGEALTFGGMMQLDRRDSWSEQDGVESTAVMAGPYAVLRLPEQPLTLSGSLLMGARAFSPLAAGTGTVAAGRSVLTLGMSGKLDFGQIVLKPQFRLVRVAGRHAAQSGRLEVMKSSAELDFSRRLSRELALTWGVTGREVLGYGSADLVQARLDFGFRYTARSGIRTRVNTYLDGSDRGRRDAGISLRIKREF